jgi:putative FmdB family regulatory protein
MPFYEYRCDNGHTFEVMQRMSDDQLTACLDCEAPVQRVFHPVAVHFKGSGFYSTDYAKKAGTSTESSGEDGKKEEPRKEEPRKEEAKKESASSSTGSSGAGSSTKAGSSPQSAGDSSSST